MCKKIIFYENSIYEKLNSEKIYNWMQIIIRHMKRLTEFSFFFFREKAAIIIVSFN